jgi:DNA invertase Pin-like site-specific DNA recombinase
MLSIAGYLRISVDEELDRDNVSIENQRAIVEKYVTENFPGARLDFYADRDMSGYTFSQREEYQKMRSKLFAHEYQIMIVKDLSRFSRRLTHGLGELEELVEAGIRIIAISDGVDIRSFADYNMLLQIRFMLNENAVTETSKKVRDIIRNRQSKGEWICSAPFGYYLNPLNRKEFLIDEKAAEIVRLIFELYNEGWGYKRIANYLTEHKYPTARMLEVERLKALGHDTSRLEKHVSDVWSAISVSGYITNDFYIGTLRQNMYRRRGINKKDMPIPQNEQLVFPNHHKAIIDPEVFYKAQENYRRRTKTHFRGTKKYANTYSGFLYCADCGSPMFMTAIPPRPPGYTCGRYHRRGVKGCTSHHIHEKQLDEYVKQYITLIRDNLNQALAGFDLEKNREEAEKNKNVIRELGDRIAALKDSLKESGKQRISQKIKNPDNSEIIDSTFDEIDSEYYAEIERLNRRMAFLQSQGEKKSELKSGIQNVVDRFNRLLEKEPLEKGDIALIIERITVDSHRIVTITLRSDLTEIMDIIEEK